MSESSRSHTMAAGYGVRQMPPFPPATCLSQAEIIAYIGDKGRCYGWHISDLRIYDTPRDLGEFIGLRTMKNGFELRELDRPPQSWCYVLEDYHA